MVSGVKLMSVSFFSGDQAVPLRGANVSDAMLELLAVTQWGGLDFLIIDMPPGINDAALDVIRLIPRAEVLAVTTPSVMARSVLERSLALYRRLRVPVLGVVANMDRGGDADRNAKWSLRWDEGLEKALGRPEMILRTGFAKDLEKMVVGLI